LVTLRNRGELALHLIRDLVEPSSQRLDVSLELRRLLWIEEPQLLAPAFDLIQPRANPSSEVSENLADPVSISLSALGQPTLDALGYLAAPEIYRRSKGLRHGRPSVRDLTDPPIRRFLV
jgi:hypothetical protein